MWAVRAAGSLGGGCGGEWCGRLWVMRGDGVWQVTERARLQSRTSTVRT